VDSMYILVMKGSDPTIHAIFTAATDIAAGERAVQEVEDYMKESDSNCEAVFYLAKRSLILEATHVITATSDDS